MNSSPRLWITLTHLSALLMCIIPVFGNIIGPLIVWLTKRDQFPEIDESGRETVNFQITASLGWLAVILIAKFISDVTITIAAPIGWVLVGCYAIAHLSLTIAGVLQADARGVHKYPFTIRLLR